MRKLFLNCLLVILIFVGLAIAQDYFPSENIRDSTGKVIDPASVSGQFSSTNILKEISSRIGIMNLHLEKITGETFTETDIE